MIFGQKRMTKLRYFVIKTHKLRHFVRKVHKKPFYEQKKHVNRDILPKIQDPSYSGRPLGRYYRPLVDNRPFCLNGRYSWICGRCYIKMVDISSKSQNGDSCYAFSVTTIICFCPNQKEQQTTTNQTGWQPFENMQMNLNTWHIMLHHGQFNLGNMRFLRKFCGRYLVDKVLCGRYLVDIRVFCLVVDIR